MQNKNKLYLVIGSVALMLSAFLIGMKVYQNQKAQKLDLISKDNFETFVPDHAVKLGPSNPKVYLVEFLDPECESCRAFYPFVKQLMHDYEGKIQLVIRYAPFHPNAMLVVKIIEAARKQGKYWETLETLLRYQPAWGSHHDPKPELVWTYLPEAGVDVEKIKKDMSDPGIEEIIRQDMRDGEKLGVRATPTFFVNGRPLEKFGPEYLRNAIERELKN